MRTAVDGGASHVGLVFYPLSPRAVTPTQAAELARKVPETVSRVGLFVDPTDTEIDAVLAEAPLELLQLHGNEAPTRVAEIRRRTGLMTMKVISVADESDFACAKAYVDVADWLMFDAKPPPGMKGALPGGNAVSFDWRILSGQKWPVPWMLAGGLHAGNVSKAVTLSGAAIVDTSSGVEDAPGRKNVDLIAAFLDVVSKIR